MKDLVIVCAGGFGREVLGLIEDINSSSRKWNIIGFHNTDQDKEEGSQPEEICGLPLLPRQTFNALPHTTCLAIATGFPLAKAEIARKLSHYTFPTLIHPSVIKSPRVQISETGCIITAGNILTTEIELKDFVTLNLACTVGHDCTIGKYSVISPGVNISGNVHIGMGCNIGTGSSIIPGKNIGDWVTVGAGAVVSKNLEPGVTAVGIPAKPISTRESMPEFS